MRFRTHFTQECYSCLEKAQDITSDINNMLKFKKTRSGEDMTVSGKELLYHKASEGLHELIDASKVIKPISPAPPKPEV